MPDWVTGLITASVKKAAEQTLGSKKKALWAASSLPSPDLLYAFTASPGGLAANDKDCLRHQREAQTRSISFL